MKLSDIFKRLGLNIEDDIDMTDTESLKVEDNIENNLVEDKTIESKDKVDTQLEKETKQEEKKMSLKFDENTGLFTGINDIEDEQLKTLLKQANTSVKNKANKAKIDGAIKTKLDTLKLIDGVSSDIVLKLLDTTGIKVQDDEVVGVNEAFDNLIKAQAGLFKKDDKTKEASPLNEGFAKPMDKTSPYSEDDLVTMAYGQE